MRGRGGRQLGGARYGQLAQQLSRMIEPSVLYLLATGAAGHGYQLAEQANQLGLAETIVEPAAVYRCLRGLEADGCVVSAWDTAGSGPARRVYQLTEAGRQRLAGWVAVINQRAQRLANFVKLCGELGIAPTFFEQ